ncbi:LysR substrate-binding domain-containing protein [Ramlibacter sp.]|uniref:LysR substrate-binding domain-containing protein n=1 Tax=Ramlibacter sp. TaxID=1917967 RepID=UPI00263651B8|nr:LysR substrate-binding domain-containing protein [Ramlibacter sp.]MDB5957962.1 transcriptional regulator, LysR family [Ramlibacter sp.]
MTLQQLRYLCGVVEHGFSVSNAARALFTSQPGISKQIQALEQELGVEILIRHGNRITGTTPAGAQIVDMARRTLQCAENIRRIGGEHAKSDNLRLVVATTHIHARYVLRPVISQYIRKHPQVELVLRQGSPAQIEQWVASGEADLGVGGNTPDPLRELVFLPCGELQRSVLTPREHPLRHVRKLTLAALARYPLITLDVNFSGGWAVINGFASAGVTPNIVLTATDADVIKSYVELGLGVAVLPTITYEPERDRKLAAIDASHLFKPTVTQVQLRRGSYLQSHLTDFITTTHARWSRNSIADALAR